VIALAPAGPAGPVTGRPRPVPWTRLAWVTWRQHRVALGGAGVLLGTFALYMLVEGLRMRSDYAAVTSCHLARSAGCEAISSLFSSTYYPNAQTLTGVLQLIPVLVGVFVGGPMLARELETGTFRFAWTQGCGRLRWVITKLALLAIAVTAAAAAFSLLFSWYFHPWFAQGFDGVLAPQLFDLRGTDFAAWTLLAFALGAAAGVVIKRVVPAMAVSLAVWTGLFFGTFLYLRKHYQAPLVTKGGAPDIDWVVGQWYTGPNGKPVSGQTINHVVQGAPRLVENSLNPGAVTNYLTQHHYTQWWAYQPQSRFWSFQLIESGWLLALSLILMAATVWLVRRRAS
jgi:hypothetical protein